MDTALIVIGGGVLERRDGSWYAKAAIRTYLSDLRSRFGRVTWMASRYEGTVLFTSKLDDSSIEICEADGRVSSFLRDLVQLWRLSRRPAAVLIHMPSPALAAAVSVLRWRFSGVFVYLACDWTSDASRLAASRGALYGAAYRCVHEVIVRRAHGVIARGAALADRVRPVNEHVIQTVPIASLSGDLSAPCRGDKPGSTVLFVGKLNQGKGLSILLRALARIRSTLSAPLRLRVIGSGESAEELFAQADGLGIGDAVDFLGYVDDPERLAEEYAQADVLVVPSIDPEGVPRVISEAFSFGVPVVASAIGGIPAEFPREIALVPPGDVEALATSIAHLISSPETRVRLVEQGKSYLERSGAGMSAGHQHADFILRRLGDDR